MATYVKQFGSGNNFFCIPLDMSDGSPGIGNDIVDLFPASMVDEHGHYQYSHIITIGEGSFNFNGTWYGNLSEIKHTQSYYIHCHNSISITFEGDALTPGSVSYTLKHGWNSVSYPFTETHDRGSGDYNSASTVLITHPLDRLLLKGSDDAKECITYIIAGNPNVLNPNGGIVGGTVSSIIHPEYSADDDFPGDAINWDDWNGNISRFYESAGIYIFVDRSANSYNDLTTTLWVDPSDSFANSLSGVSLLHTEGDHGFDFPQNVDNTYTHLVFAHGFKIVEDVSGTDRTVLGSNLLSVNEDAGEYYVNYGSNFNILNYESAVINTTDQSLRSLGFFIHNKIGFDADFQLYGCRGGVTHYDRYNYSSGTTIAFSDSAGTGASGIVYILQDGANTYGSVLSVTMVNGGENYTGSTTVAFTDTDGNGTSATGTATIVAGSVTAVTITNGGSGYDIGIQRHSINSSTGYTGSTTYNTYISTTPGSGSVLSGIEAPESSYSANLVIFDGTKGTFNLLHDTAGLQYSLSITNYYHPSMDLTDEGRYRFKGFHSSDSVYSTSNSEGVNFGLSNKIAPIIYDPSKDDGERYRFCKYHPHINDLIYGNYEYSGLPLIANPDFADLVWTGVPFESNRIVNDKYGENYIPFVNGFLQFKIIQTGQNSGLDHIIYKLYGILEVL